MHDRPPCWKRIKWEASKGLFDIGELNILRKTDSPVSLYDDFEQIYRVLQDIRYRT